MGLRVSALASMISEGCGLSALYLLFLLLGIATRVSEQSTKRMKPNRPPRKTSDSVRSHPVRRKPGVWQSEVA